jgi:predicted  nucleic acid-binding Zn-ribbon protein
MQEATTPPPQTQLAQGSKLPDLQPEVDERDETIRLLNEALAEALDELERLTDEQAA